MITWKHLIGIIQATVFLSFSARADFDFYDLNTSTFTKDNQDFLCVPSNAAAKTAPYPVLIEHLIRSAAINIDRPIDGYPVDRSKEAFLDDVRHFLLEDNEWEQNGNRFETFLEDKKKREALDSIRAGLEIFLSTQKKNSSYKVTLDTSLVRPNIGRDPEGKAKILAAYINESSDVVISCEPPESDTSSNKKRIDFRLRSDINDLWVDPSDLGQLKAFGKLAFANFSWQTKREVKIDYENLKITDSKSEAFTAKATLGVSFALDTQARMQLIPFLQLDRSISDAVTVTTLNGVTTETSSDEEVHNVSGGVLINSLIIANPVPLFGTVRATLSARKTWDSTHDARYGVAELVLVPTWQIGPAGPTNTDPFAQNRSFGCQAGTDLGPIYLNCDTKLIVQAAKIWEAGTHTELLNNKASDFKGAGGELSLKLGVKHDTFEKGNPFQRAYIKGTLRKLWTFDGELENQSRYELTFGVTLDDRDKLSLEITRVNGDNVTSYLPESLTKVSFGFKF